VLSRLEYRGIQYRVVQTAALLDFQRRERTW
jgi:hypothetical protein